jgi:ribosome-binding protein aMBF1 (putative translation factor)
MDKDTYQMIADEFEKTFPTLSKDVVDYYPTGYLELTLKLSDGTKIRYDHISKTYEGINDSDKSKITEEEWTKEFGRRLARKIKSVCITQEELSKRTNISRISINNYINGKAVPSGYYIHKIANALNCSSSELMYFD